MSGYRETCHECMNRKFEDEEKARLSEHVGDEGTVTMATIESYCSECDCSICPHILRKLRAAEARLEVVRTATNAKPRASAAREREETIRSASDIINDLQAELAVMRLRSGMLVDAIRATEVSTYDQDARARLITCIRAVEAVLGDTTKTDTPKGEKS